MTSGATISGGSRNRGSCRSTRRCCSRTCSASDRAWLVAHASDALAARARRRVLRARAAAPRRRAGRLSHRACASSGACRSRVSPAVLIPRPETETLVELALARLPADRDVRVLDLGTGSGAIALAIAHERPRASVLATDISAAALDVARDNARSLGLANVEFARSDWYDAFAPWRGGAFDLIVEQSALRRRRRSASRAKATCASSRALRSRRAATASARSARSSPARARASRPAARSSSSTATTRRTRCARCSRPPDSAEIVARAISPAFRASSRRVERDSSRRKRHRRHARDDADEHRSRSARALARNTTPMPTPIGNCEGTPATSSDRPSVAERK